MKSKVFQNTSGFSIEIQQWNVFGNEFCSAWKMIILQDVASNDPLIRNRVFGTLNAQISLPGRGIDYYRQHEDFLQVWVWVFNNSGIFLISHLDDRAPNEKNQKNRERIIFLGASALNFFWFSIDWKKIQKKWFSSQFEIYKSTNSYSAWVWWKNFGFKNQK